MSPKVEFHGREWPRSLFTPPEPIPPGACPRCGGLRVVIQVIDAEGPDVVVPCPRCRAIRVTVRVKRARRRKED
jgi:hypothetical protein